MNFRLPLPPDEQVKIISDYLIRHKVLSNKELPNHLKDAFVVPVFSFDLDTGFGETIVLWRFLIEVKSKWHLFDINTNTSGVQELMGQDPEILKDLIDFCKKYQGSLDSKSYEMTLIYLAHTGVKLIRMKNLQNSPSGDIFISYANFQVTNDLGLPSKEILNNEQFQDTSKRLITARLDYINSLPKDDNSSIGG